MGRRKFSATELMDAQVYNLWITMAPPAAGDRDATEEGPDMGVFNELVDRGADPADIDLGMVPMWIERLKGAEVGLHQWRLQLEALLSERRCATCSGPVAGRSDRVYCSARCRVAAHRSGSSSS